MSDYKIWTLMKYATAKSKDILNAALESDNYCLQLKKDGASYIWAKDLDGSVHLYKDSISKKTGELIDKIENVPHMKEFAEKNFPVGTQFLTEICYKFNWKDGVWDTHSYSKYVTSIMGSDPPKAIKRQKETAFVDAYVFDCLYWEGEEIYRKDFADRWARVEESFSYFSVPHWLSLAETVFEDKESKIAEWLAADEEGGVLKALHSVGKVDASFHVRDIGKTEARPMHTTYKIKQVDTVDVVIMGVEMPTKEYLGKNPETYEYRDEEGNAVNKLWALGYANSFVIGAYEDGVLTRIGSVYSGLDYEILERAANEPNYYIGQTIEVTCMSKDNKSKTLRHPRLCCFRPDKPAEQCRMEEIFS